MADPEKSLLIIRQKVTELHEFASAVQDYQIQLRDDDYIGFMLFFFPGKQIEHTKGILALAECGLYRDAGLIARSMAEGLVQLLWAYQEPQVRDLKWKQFSCVSSWRKLNRDEKAFGGVDPHLRADIERWRQN